MVRQTIPQKRIQKAPQRKSSLYAELTLAPIHWVLFIVIILGVGGILYDLYDDHEPIETAIDIDNMEKTYNALRFEGLLIRLNVQEATAMVSDAIWDGLPGGQKNTIAVFLCNYVAHKVHKPQFKITIIGVGSKMVLGKIDSTGFHLDDQQLVKE